MMNANRWMKAFVLVKRLCIVGIVVGVIPLDLTSAGDEVVMTDITTATGIAWVHSGGSPEKRNIREQIGSGVALFDYDGDGWIDIYFLSGLGPSGSGRNSLYRNNGDGTFTDVTVSAGVGYQGWSMGVCVGDFDGDGNPDLYVTNLGPNILYRNNGDGTFTDVAAKAGVDYPGFSTGCAFGDYDRDGFIDLFVANYVIPYAEDRLCDYYGLRVACGPRGMDGASNILYRNEGNGTFRNVSRETGVEDHKKYYSLGAIWTDIDGDGDLDLFVANDRTPNYLYVNNLDQGSPTFEERGFLAGVAVGADGQMQASMGIDVGDYDRDGNLDIVVTNFAREFNALYRNMGGGFFSDVVQQASVGLPSLLFVGWGAGFVDLNNNGYLDLFLANGHTYPQVELRQWDEHYAQRNQIFLNSGEGKFSQLRLPDLEAVECSRGVAFGDLNNDGYMDVVVSNVDAPPTLLRNDTRRGGNWLLVQLRGRAPNTLAIGAQARCFVDGRLLLEEVRSGGSYLSQNDLRVHFGLGSATRAQRLVIRWPDGREHILENVPANQILVVEQKEKQ